MKPDNSYRKRVRIATVIIIVAAVIGASLIVIVSLPGISILSPYQEYKTDMTLSPPANSYNISISANDSNIQVYQGSNSSIYVSVTVTGWVKLSGQDVYISKYVTGNTVQLVVNTPRFIFAYTSNAKLYLPSSAMAENMGVDTANGNQNVYGPLNAINMTLSTTNGNIGSLGLNNGTVDASTVNGNINIASTTLSVCDENTVNGNLQLTLSDTVRSGSFSLDSVNGNQDLYLNRLSNTTLSLSTVNGNIAVTNLEVDTSSSTSRSLQGTVNGGGAMVSMKTSNGNIRITGI